MSSAAAALAVIGPIARANALESCGVARREIARALRAGEIVRLRQGVYALTDAPSEFVHAAEHGGAPSCVTAGRMHGLWILDEEQSELHLWLGDGGRRRACGRRGCRGALRVHWDEGSTTIGRLPPVRSVLLQIALCAGEECFFAALESALRQNLLSASGLKWLRARLPTELRWLVTFARADADSGLESLLRLRLHRLGIAVRTQVAIEGVGEVDFVIGERLIVEADGRENHDDLSGRSRRHKDLVRDARAAALGYETLRFDYALIVHEWETVAAAIVAKVAAGAHH